MDSPYKKSIWDFDARYGIDSAEIGDSERKTISRLMSVDAAKKNVPPVPISGLLEISNLAKGMPDAVSATKEDIENFIGLAKRFNGAGVPTVICMLAVETDGDYPPMDRRFSSGLEKKGIVSKAYRKSLKGGSIKKFSRVYVEKVIPAWKESLKGRTPQEADNYWGRGGSDG
ncbi:hypothetical protein A3754_08420 [Alcanivorax sp. HI0083]|uniref:hypothetical protein n=1 Tax=unclassified Alcanivorax TaxID=2638842 RepID=UPI0007BAA49B|nr:MULTISPECIES: hypothetical protein [unclassified Alcanivorax]KZY33591.1 hypothetical protein A3730_03835 [Alcanivorax sp. HI0044]KZY38929.1 hypothetical protein A3730_24480 [Alcanivorax sp. HI0044]KZZ27206.1 hypothetical protein A3754_08420 [Alcanivorax sp. HI0083]